MAFNEWLAQADGKKMNLDGAYGQQCVDVFLDYAQYLFGSIWRTTTGWGNAKDLFANSNPSYWQKIANSPDPNHIPQAGDVVVWNAKGTNPYGHIAVVISANSSNITVLQQDGFIDYNNDGNADGVGHRKVQTWSAVIGWLRPIIKVTTGDKPMNRDEEANAYRIILQREMEHAGSGRTGYQFITAAHAELNNQRANVNNQLQALQTALTNEQAKPPKEIVKEVKVIVEKLVEVQVPVYTHDENTKNFVAAIYNYFYTRYQTFRDSLKK